MKISHVLLLWFFLVLVATSSCKKDSKKGVSPQDSLSTLNGCLPVSDARRVFDEQELTEYSYNEKGVLKRINIFIQPGKILTEKKELKYNSEGLLSEYIRTININEFGNSSRFLVKLMYDNGSKHADKAELFELSGTSDPLWLKKFTMVRTGDNVLQKVIEETPLVSGDIEYTYHFEYNPQGNVSRMVVTPTGNHTSFQYELGEYDSNPSTVNNIPDAMYLNFPITNVLPWATALSKNNPGSLIGIEAKFAILMTYTYNEKGYPLSRRDDVATSTGKYIEGHVFGYRCK